MRDLRFQRFPGLTVFLVPGLCLHQWQILLLFLFQRLNTLWQGVQLPAAKSRVQACQQDRLLADCLPQICHHARQSQNQHDYRYLPDQRRRFLPGSRFCTPAAVTTPSV
ncbi:hypothetical protein D0B42_24040 [Salmonella enterica]|nr:hypothetical protein [Salmonella enterica]EBM4432358.1 hypothetical protein [Salmonella enterica]